MKLAPRPRGSRAAAAPLAYDYLLSKHNQPQYPNSVVTAVQKLRPDLTARQIRDGITNSVYSGTLIRVYTGAGQEDRVAINNYDNFQVRRAAALETWSSGGRRRRKAKKTLGPSVSTPTAPAEPIAPPPPWANTYNHIFYSILLMFHEEGKSVVSFNDIYSYQAAAMEGTTKQPKTRKQLASTLHAVAYKGYIVLVDGKGTRTKWRLATAKEFTAQQAYVAALPSNQPEYQSDTNNKNVSVPRTVKDTPAEVKPLPEMYPSTVNTVNTFSIAKWAFVGGVLGGVAVALSWALWSSL